MDFNDYQHKARTTAIYPTAMTIIYPALGLAGEAGEVCEKVKKLYRDKGGTITNQDREAIKKELGDVLWYVSNIAFDLDINLSDIAEENIKKLQQRKAQNTLKGEGDDR